MLTSDTVGGVWQYTLQLARALAKYGVEITLVSIGRRPSFDQAAELAQLTNLRRHVNLPYKLEWMQDSLADVAAARGDLSDLIESQQPDLLHSSQFCFGDLPTAIPRLVVAHSDILSWQHWCADPNTPPDANWQRFILDYRRLVQCGLHGANAVVAPSQFMADSIGSDYALPPARIHVIPNGVTICSRMGVKEQMAITVGRMWDRAKNIGVVLEAARQTQAEDRLPVEVMLVGEDLPTAQHAVADGDGGIKYLGYLPSAKLYTLLARASVYIASSRYEPFGLAAVEAALHGCAIIANDIPTFHEVWGDDAVYFERNNPASLHRVLTHLLTDPTIAASYGARAHLRALKRYTAERMAANYYQLYQQMLPSQLWYNQGAVKNYPDVEANLGV